MQNKKELFKSNFVDIQASGYHHDYKPCLATTLPVTGQDWNIGGCIANL